MQPWRLNDRQIQWGFIFPEPHVPLGEIINTLTDKYILWFQHREALWRKTRDRAFFSEKYCLILGVGNHITIWRTQSRKALRWEGGHNLWEHLERRCIQEKQAKNQKQSKQIYNHWVHAGFSWPWYLGFYFMCNEKSLECILWTGRWYYLVHIFKDSLYLGVLSCYNG